ncbi:MAG: hypothetical protein JNK82_36430 [Myxococcaceae bacterium]|nr:hypothetical protein [Myxococcaceae bacterium]
MRLIRLAVLLWGAVAAAQGVPQRLSFTGNLTNSGAPETGNHDFTFRLFDAPTGGTQAWTETQTGIVVTNGMVFATLGGVTPLTPAIFNGATLYLEVQVDTTVLSPRSQIASVPYAIRAGVANTAEAIGSLQASAVQQRVSNMCSGMNAIQTIAADGQVTCVAVGGGGGGDITSVAAGSGLQGGGITGDVSLALTTCPAGQVLKSNGAQWVCAADNDTGPPTASAPLSVTGRNVSLTLCGANQVYKVVAGAWACAADDNTVYTSAIGISIAGTAIGVDSSIVARKDGNAGNQAFDVSTLYLDYTNNRVGVLNTAPTVALDVGGAIRGTSLNLTNAVFGYYNQPGHAFSVDVGASGSWNVNSGFGNLTAGTSITLGTQVALPDGVTIDRFDCYRYDNDAANSIGGTMTLYRRLYSSTAQETLASVSIATTVNSTSVQAAGVVVTPATVVDNDSYQYFIYGSFSNSPALDTLLRFYGCRVRYTYTNIRF